MKATKILTSLFIFIFLISSVMALPVAEITSPDNGTIDTNLEVNIISYNETPTYVLPDINSSVIGWYSFENNSVEQSRYGSGTNFTTINSEGDYGFDYGQGIALTATTATGTDFPDLNLEGFAIAFDFFVNDTSDAAVVNSNFLLFSSGYTGFQGWLSNTDDTMQIRYLVYNGSNYDGAAYFRFNNSIMDEPQRILLNIDFIEGVATTWVNGELSYTDTSIPSYGFMVQSNKIGFVSTTEDHTRYVDELVIINKSLTAEEAEIYSTHSDNTTMQFSSYGDYSFNLKSLGYGEEGIGESDLRYYENQLSPQLEYSNIVPTYTSMDVDETTDLYCQHSYEGVTDDQVTNIIQYTDDSGETWNNMSGAWQTPDDYLILGDSMSYQMVAGFWPYYFKELTATTDADFTNLAFSGRRCSYAYDLIQNNVSEDEFDYLFFTCGVNGFATEDNTYYWEAVYEEAKDKGIEAIYMTTMPPWDYINEQNETYANTLCDKQHTENEWLLAFAEAHDDVYVYDLWEDWNDESGTNLTDCGWRTDQGTLTGDGVHPSSIGAEYWANRHWDNFNQWRANTTKATFIAPSIEEESGATYDFRCFGTYDSRQSLINEFNEISVTYDETTEINYEVRESANEIKTTVFAAFGIIALFVIIGAGYLIVRMFSGGVDVGMMTVLLISALIVTIILLAGFFILGTLASVI